MSRVWIALGAIFGLISVAMAAYASHGLPADRAGLAMTGASLGAWHALALIGAGLLAERRRGWMVHAAASLFAVGTVAFCSGVYLRALTDYSIGMVTPIGGTLLMVAWGVFGVAALLSPTRQG